MTWTPALTDGPEPIWRRLSLALEADVRSGALAPGERLPPQRDLAYALGLGVGTVTRAYAEAERRGLIEGQVGRGSFVAAQRARADGDDAIDLGRNLPPLGPAAARIADAFARLARRRDVADLLAYPDPRGAAPHRAAGARWITRTSNHEATAERLLITAGAQQAVAVALMTLCRPGDTLLAEAATFAGVKTLAARAGYRLAPGEMDAEGLTPEALDRAAAAGAKVAYLMPVQNPTARVMSLERRTAVVEVARRRDLQIVEDDLYGAFAAPLGLPPLAALAPERTTYVGGLSKALAPGLRVGFLVPPAALAERMQEALRAIAFGAPTFGPAVAAAWIEDGTAFDILGEVLRETEARADIARSILGRAAAPSPLAAQPHLWLPMSELEAERLYGRALRAGVRLTPPGAVAVDGAPVQGLRLCLGGPASRVTLERGLRCVAQALTADPAEVGDVV